MRPWLIVIVATTPSTPTTAPTRAGPVHRRRPEPRWKAMVVPSPIVTGAVRRTHANTPGRIDPTRSAPTANARPAQPRRSHPGRGPLRDLAQPRHEPVGVHAAHGVRSRAPSPSGNHADARIAVTSATTTATPAATRSAAAAAPASCVLVMPITRNAGASSLTTAADAASAWPTRTSPARATTAASSSSAVVSTSSVVVTRSGDRMLVEQGRALCHVGVHVALELGHVGPATAQLDVRVLEDDRPWPSAPRSRATASLGRR